MQKGVRAAIPIKCSATTADTPTTDHTDRDMKPDTRKVSATRSIQESAKRFESINLRVIGHITNTKLGNPNQNI